MTNCPNCGAVLSGNVCEYCGTNFSQKPLIQFPNAIAYGEPFDLRIVFDRKHELVMKCYIGTYEIHQNPLIEPPVRDSYGRVTVAEPWSKRRIRLELIEV